MKILHIVPYLPKSSGVTTFVDALTAECVKLGNVCKVVVGDFNWAGQGCTQVEGVSRLSVSEGLDALQNEHWDVVHIHALWLPFIHRFVTLVQKKHVPIIWSVHGSLSPWAFRFKWWKKLPVWWLWQRHDIRLAKALHVTSVQEADWIKEYCFNVPIVDIPLGTHGVCNMCCSEFKVSSSRMVEGGNVCSAVNTTGPRIKRLLFVGRVAPVKALPKLIEAWAKACLKQWELRIVGNGESTYVEMLKTQAEALGVGAQVHFVGPRYDEGLLEEYRLADALALVSETENFGAVVTDAMAHGLPVITSKGTRWSEVEEHQCGWWVDNDVDSLTKVLQSLGALSDAERAQMGENGKRLIQEKYTWPAVAKQMLVFYECLRRS